MSTYKNLQHHSRTENNLPFYRPLDSLVAEGSKHKKTFFSAAFVVIFLTLVYLGMNYYQTQYQEKASALFQKGESKSVIEQYPRSHAAILAKVKLAGESLKAEKYDDALSYYKELSEKKSLPSLIRIGASQNLALVYLKKGQNDLALDTLQKLALDPENAHQDYSKLLEAHVWEAKGDESKSQQIYKQLSEGATANEIKEEAKARLKVSDASPVTSPVVNPKPSDTAPTETQKTSVKIKTTSKKKAHK